jgi:hypothetical protein
MDRSRSKVSIVLKKTGIYEQLFADGGLESDVSLVLSIYKTVVS